MSDTFKIESMVASGTDWKAHFSSFGGKAYLDCAAQGPFPMETAEAVRGAVRYKEHPEEIADGAVGELPDRARAAVARLIGCSPASITLGTGASHGINIAARGLPLKQGDEVLMAQGEFPALVYPYLNLQAEGGVTVRFVEPAAGRMVTAEDLIRAIGPRTRVIATSLVTFSTGYRIDLQPLGEACRKRGIFLVIDAAQAIGGIDFRVADLAIDVLAVSGYKWLLGPYGTGFTYINPRVLDRVRTVDVNWARIEGANRTSRRTEYRLRFLEGAQRFDMPETGSFTGLTGFATSVEFLNRVRIPTVELHVARLFERLAEGIERTALRIVSDPDPKRRSNILALEAPTVEATRRIHRRLRHDGIIVSYRENMIRVSPNLYNGPEDIDRLLESAASAGGT